jgi:hypothetical protein
LHGNGGKTPTTAMQVSGGFFRRKKAQKDAKKFQRRAPLILPLRLGIRI